MDAQQSGLKRVAHGCLMRHLAFIGQLRADEQHLHNLAALSKLGTLRDDMTRLPLLPSPLETSAAKTPSPSVIIIDSSPVRELMDTWKARGELPYRIDLMINQNLEEQLASWQSLLKLVEREAQEKILVEADVRAEEETGSAISRRARRRRVP